MKDHNFFPLKPARFAARLAILFCPLLCVSQFLQAADYGEEPVEWQFESGSDRKAFVESFKDLSGKGYRIADIESYRTGRLNSVSTIWIKHAETDAWKIETSMPISDFLKAHEEHQKSGYSLVEFEADRTGATLHFSGIWLKSEKPVETEFYFGMESLEFSNRYGEMADRGYRLIDFEAYQSIGKDRHSGLWLKNDGHEVRFYRGIAKNRFGEVTANMTTAGFRLIDVEAYEYEGKFVFAGQWVRLAKGQESQYDFDLLADEFYNKNAAYVNDGYRLTEFEVYENQSGDTLYYAGSWLKGVPKGSRAKKEEEKPEPKKSMSLEAFRSGSTE